MSADDLDKRFTYHPPKDNQPARYEAIRTYARNLAGFVDDNAPDSREKSLALTHLEECVMWANAAIARNELWVSASTDITLASSTSGRSPVWA